MSPDPNPSAALRSSTATPGVTSRTDGSVAGSSNGRVQVGGAPQPARPRTKRGWLVRRLLLAADLIGLLSAFALTEAFFRGHSGLIENLGVATEALVFMATLPAWVVGAKLYGLYDRDTQNANHTTVDEFPSIFHFVTVAVWLFFAGSWITGLTQPSQLKLATFWLLAIAGIAGSRVAARALARRRPSYVQNAIIVGAGEVGQLIARKIRQHPEMRTNVVGFVDADPRERRRDLGDLPVLGRQDELAEIVRRQQIDRIIVAFSKTRDEQTLELMRAIRERDVQIDLVPRLFEGVGANVVFHSIEGLPLLGLRTSRLSRSSGFLKRCLDIAGAGVLLALVAPLMLVIAFVIRRDSPGPVFFRQKRLGMDLREFTLVKFRTMRDGTDDGPHREYISQIISRDALPNSNNLYKLERPNSVTRVGRWLRRTSLDELPQLLNVLRGDMSLVGPRPLIPYELEFLEAHHYERFLVPAGLTGLWQVEARAHSTFGEALDLDVVYARSWSLGLDLRLFFRTPLVMFRSQETG